VPPGATVLGEASVDVVGASEIIAGGALGTVGEQFKRDRWGIHLPSPPWPVVDDIAGGELVHHVRPRAQAAANSRSTLLGLKFPLPRSPFTPSVFMAKVRLA
jgi:hypothetical protein